MRGPALPPEVFAADCEGRPVFDSLTSRWAVLVLGALRVRPHRFAELAGGIQGVSEKMLAQTLRTLTRDGFVRRSVTGTVPMQTTYALTELGAEVTPQVVELALWVRRHAGDIRAARAAHDTDRPIPPAVANRR
ncbi:winged helix-turn-helix transcriptional regulator [Symbioplanes lichenis]|uniref:winged helix-turn-helix transcriptional regulator n=1 Tax=Symbioplanes lichenis TaxID=1629072 RepID=UPI002739F3D6|nr:helix-turn-helix domain-containing protein [Actinoplanes lichenis]